MKAVLEAGGRRYEYYPIADAFEGASRLPFSLKVVLENLLRHGANAEAIRKPGTEIGFRPARVIMPDSSGVPLLGGVTRNSLRLDGSERIDILGVSQLSVRGDVECTVIRNNGTGESVRLLARVDAGRELEYFRHGGLLQYLLRRK